MGFTACGETVAFDPAGAGASLTQGDGLPMLTTNLLDTLLARFLAGERHLLEEIARLGEPAMRFWIERALVRRGDRRYAQLEHSEIFQRVYLQLWRRGRQSVGTEVRNPTGYLRRVVQNAVVDWLRRPPYGAPSGTSHGTGHGASTLVTTNAVETVPSPEPFPEEVAEFGEELERLRQAMTQPERRVWDLLSHGCSWDEVAKRLGVSRRVARARFRRLITRLQGQLGRSERGRWTPAMGAPSGLRSQMMRRGRTAR